MTRRVSLRRWLPALLAVGAAVAVACGSAAESGLDSSDGGVTRIFGSEWRTDFSKHSIDLSEFLSGGPGKDGIPALDQPRFVAVQAGDAFLVDREPVIALELNGDARAYPLQILTRHEIVNDTVSGVPIAVTFCPLCNSAIAFERDLNGVVYDFGVSGMLRNSDLVMYDRQTESWWQQFTGEAVVGELTGALLEVVPTSIVSWGDFKATFPDGQVLSRETGFPIDYGFNPYINYDSDASPFLFRGEIDPRLSPIERVVAVELNGEAVAYPFSLLEERRVVQDTVGGQRIAVFFQPGSASALDQADIAASRDVGAAGVFQPQAQGRALTFRADGGAIVDNETGSRWNVLGLATNGPLAGQRLTPVVHGDHFWFAWAAFKPQTRVFSG